MNFAPDLLFKYSIKQQEIKERLIGEKEPPNISIKVSQLNVDVGTHLRGCHNNKCMTVSILFLRAALL